MSKDLIRNGNDNNLHTYVNNLVRAQKEAQHRYWSSAWIPAPSEGHLYKNLLVCASCVASESRPLETAGRQVAGDLSSGRGGGQAKVMRALPRIVDAVDVLSFLRDTLLRRSAEQCILHLDVPTVCTDATGFQRGGSRKEQCIFVSVFINTGGSLTAGHG